MANNSDRSKWIKFDPRAKTGNYKRSSHNDFATSAELKQRKFDGWRQNKIQDRVELWIDGEIRASVSVAELALDPQACEKKMVEVFGIS